MGPRPVFLLDVVIDGPEGSAWAEHLCLESFITKGSIETRRQTVESEVIEVGSSRATTQIDSSALSAIVNSNAGGTLVEQEPNITRWFYEENGRVRYFDARLDPQILLPGNLRGHLHQDLQGGSAPVIRGSCHVQ